jgi:hypothetical protein
MSANAEFLDTLVSMGFERTAARVALEASVNDFDRAVHLLGTSQSLSTGDGVEHLNQVIFLLPPQILESAFV